MKEGKKAGKRRGRTVKFPISSLIPDTPENVARAVMTTPPEDRDDWDYLKAAEGRS